MPSPTRAGTDDDTWLALPGKTLTELQDAAIERAVRSSGAPVAGLLEALGASSSKGKLAARLSGSLEASRRHLEKLDDA